MAITLFKVTQVTNLASTY